MSIHFARRHRRASAVRCAARLSSATAGLLLGLTAIPIAAQEATALPDVDVSGAATSTGTATSIDRDALRASQTGSSDTARILRSIPGVSGYDAGGVSTVPVIRGLEGDRVAVTVDGVSIATACPNAMNPPLSYTDPQTVRAINVVTGVSPVSMGGDSIGGVIAVDSAAPRFATGTATLLTGEASAFYRSNGDGFGGALTATVASDSLSLTYNGSYAQSDNISGGGHLGTVRSTEFAKTDHALAFAAQTGAGLFELKGGFHSAPYEGFPNQYMDMTANKSWFVNGHYAGVFDWGDVDLRAHYRTITHRMNFLADKGGTAGGGMPMDTDVRQAGYAVKLGIPLAGGTLRLGNEFQHQWLNDDWPPVAGSMMMGPNRYININGSKRDRLGSYIEWERTWDGGVSLIAGIRNDQLWMNTGNVQPYGTNMMQMADVMAAMRFNAVDHARHDSNWGGSLLLRAPLGDTATVELGYARKVRSPNVYERYSWGRGSMSSRMIGWFGDGNGYVGNIDLKPERADTLSAAVTLHGEGADGWQLRVAPYYTRVHDYIDVVKIADFTGMGGRPTGFVQLRFVNQRAAIHGVDVTGSLPLWSGPSGSARLTARGSWLHGENLTDHAPLYHQMPFNGAVALDYRLGGWQAQLSLDWAADKRRVDPTRNEPRTDGYALLGGQIAYAWGGYRVTLSAENLLDKAYYAPLGGQSLGDFRATGTLRPVPGRGRSVNLGFGVAF
jgi:iron complex outermembrane receptor protein